MKRICLMAAGLAALACSENESLVGKWMQAVRRTVLQKVMTGFCRWSE